MADNEVVMKYSQKKFKKNETFCPLRAANLGI